MKKINLNLKVVLLGAAVMIMGACSKQDEGEENASKITDEDSKKKQSMLDSSNTQDHLPELQRKPDSLTLHFGNGFGSIETQIRQQMGDRNAGPAETLLRIREIWPCTWVPSFDQTLEGSNNDPRNLPDIFKSLSPDATSFIEMLRANKIRILSTVEEKEACYAIAVLSSLAAMSDGNDLAAMLGLRSNTLPVSKGDLVVYLALSDSVKNIPSTAAIENWVEMTAASNPVYRLIALEAGKKAQPESWRNVANKETPTIQELAKIRSDKMAFYRRYINETDPVILGKLIEVLASASSKEAQQTLQMIRERQAKLGASDIVRRADQAIEELDKLIKAE